MAPELLRGECTNNEKSDIYSLGVLMYEVFSGRNPYEGESCYEVLKQVCDPEIKKRPPIPDSCSNKIGELIRNSMSDTPSFRPTAEYIDLTLRVEGSVKERVCKLEQLNAHLAVANERIEEASKMQLEHFACMSHEIRTPLASQLPGLFTDITKLPFVASPCSSCFLYFSCRTALLVFRV